MKLKGAGMQFTQGKPVQDARMFQDSLYRAASAPVAAPRLALFAVADSLSWQKALQATQLVAGPAPALKLFETTQVAVKMLSLPSGRKQCPL